MDSILLVWPWRSSVVDCVVRLSARWEVQDSSPVGLSLWEEAQANGSSDRNCCPSALAIDHAFNIAYLTQRKQQRARRN